MTDVARLAIVVESQQADTAEARLDGLAGAADRAEAQVHGLAAAARGTSGPLQAMNAGIMQQQRALATVQRGMGLTVNEGLNLSRQMTDIGVTMAMGMNPFMIAVQQGPQIMDVFQMAAIRTGTTVRAAMAATAAAVWTALAPLLPIIAAIAAAVGVVTGAFALLNRQIAKAYPDDITKGLGLTEEQLERVESKTVTFGDTVAATFTVIGKHIMDSAIGDALRWVGDRFSEAFDFATKVVISNMATIVGVVAGTFKTISDNWRTLPAILGDAVISSANLVIRTSESLVNTAIAGIEKVIAGAKALGQFVPGLSAAALLPDQLGRASFGQLANPWAGAGRAAGAAWANNVATEIQSAEAGIYALLDEIGDEALRRATKRALEEAGKPNKTGKTEAEREIERTLRYVQSLKDQAATLGMSAIASKEYEINQHALAAAEHGLEAEVRAAGAALLDKMRIEATDIKGKSDQLAMLRLEATLIGTGNIERAVQIAQLRERQRLIAAGVSPNSPDGLAAVKTAGNIARQTEENRTTQDRYNDSLRQTLDLAMQVDEHARDMARGLASAFGEPGRTLGDLMTQMTGYQARLEEIGARERAMREAGTLTAERAAEMERDRAHAQIQNYGNMAGAAKGFFSEGSDGYRLMLTLEQLYRAQQLAGMAMSMITGKQETAASIAGSMARGAAYLAEGASKMFASLGPYAFPAVAAMIAVLAGLGLRGGGGGKSGGAVNDNDATTSVRSSGVQQQAMREQAEAVGRLGVDVRVSADKDGLNAYVVKTAEDVAAPMAARAENSAVNRSVGAARRGAPAAQQGVRRLGK